MTLPVKDNSQIVADHTHEIYTTFIVKLLLKHIFNPVRFGIINIIIGVEGKVEGFSPSMIVPEYKHGAWRQGVSPIPQNHSSTLMFQ